ncbi:MAG: glycerol-3-phosphate 1-O-acyltransferase PlsY [Gemmatimonadota bacterium]|nr:glycerol-3-phosphate 1-O-acyltransferase PlsY [Gemmatimonadota bacterium]
MQPVVGAVLAYLLGSIPSAYLAGKWIRGIDLREHGSGNLGATNALRVLGATIGVPVLLIDIIKGAVPVALFARWFDVGPSAIEPEWYAIICGVCAILGHVRPIFLLWKGGGKGVATAAGVFLGLTLVPTLVSIAVFFGVVLLSGYVSLGSLTASVVLPIGVAIQYGARSPRFWLSVLVAVFVFWTHRANIDRLRSGEEHRFGRTKKSDERGGERRTVKRDQDEGAPQ